MRNAKRPRRNLRHAGLAQLVQQGPVADLKPLCRLLPVPAVFLEDLKDDLSFEVLSRLLRNVLERHRLTQVDLSDDTFWSLRHQLRDQCLLAADQHVTADEILKLPDVTG